MSMEEHDLDYVIGEDDEEDDEDEDVPPAASEMPVITPGDAISALGNFERPFDASSLDEADEDDGANHGHEISPMNINEDMAMDMAMDAAGTGGMDHSHPSFQNEPQTVEEAVRAAEAAGTSSETVALPRPKRKCRSSVPADIYMVDEQKEDDFESDGGAMEKYQIHEDEHKHDDEYNDEHTAVNQSGAKRQGQGNLEKPLVKKTTRKTNLSSSNSNQMKKKGRGRQKKDAHVEEVLREHSDKPVTIVTPCQQTEISSVPCQPKRKRGRPPKKKEHDAAANTTNVTPRSSNSDTRSKIKRSKIEKDGVDKIDTTKSSYITELAPVVKKRRGRPPKKCRVDGTEKKNSEKGGGGSAAGLRSTRSVATRNKVKTTMPNSKRHEQEKKEENITIIPTVNKSRKRSTRKSAVALPKTKSMNVWGIYKSKSKDEIIFKRRDLPSISEVLKRSDGLVGLLREDRFDCYNLEHGPDSLIALKLIKPLFCGTLPDCIQDEKPFHKRQIPEDIEKATKIKSEGKRVSSRFYGVSIFENGNNVKEYCVELPKFDVYHEFSGHVHSTALSGGKSDFSSLPRNQTAGGINVFIRTDLDEEDTAARLYAFVVRIFYGHEAVSLLHEKS